MSKRNVSLGPARLGQFMFAEGRLAGAHDLLRADPKLRIAVGDEVEAAGDEVTKRTRDAQGRFV